MKKFQKNVFIEYYYCPCCFVVKILYIICVFLTVCSREIDESSHLYEYVKNLKMYQKIKNVLKLTSIKIKLFMKVTVVKITDEVWKCSCVVFSLLLKT